MPHPQTLSHHPSCWCPFSAPPEVSWPQQVASVSWQGGGSLALQAGTGHSPGAEPAARTPPGAKAGASPAPAHPAFGQGAAQQPWQATRVCSRVLPQALRNRHLMEEEVLLMGCVTPSTATATPLLSRWIPNTVCVAHVPSSPPPRFTLCIAALPALLRSHQTYPPINATPLRASWLLAPASPPCQGGAGCCERCRAWYQQTPPRRSQQPAALRGGGTAEEQGCVFVATPYPKYS